MSVQVKLLIGFFKGLSKLSLRQAQTFGAVIGGGLALLPEAWCSPKRVTRINLEVAFPELTQQERRQLVRQSLIELGKTAAELGPVWLKPLETVQSWIHPPQNEALFEAARQKGKGVIVLMPHLGCWEAIAAYLAPIEKITYLYRPPDLVEIEDFMVRVRSRAGANLVPTNVKGVMALTRALKRGEFVGILPDQDPGEVGSVYAPFFGHPARTMTLISKLIQKTDCEVLFLSLKRLPKGQGFQPVWQAAPEGLADQDEIKAASALNLGVEQLVRQFPAQYQWEYKRFRHPPAGVVDIYRKEGGK